MEENDIEKTAFSPENGHYEFLENGPATFQRCMDHILGEIETEKCVVYFDDLLIFSTSLQKHIEMLRKVFQRLRYANSKIQVDKSELLRKEVT